MHTDSVATIKILTSFSFSFVKFNSVTNKRTNKKYFQTKSASVKTNIVAYKSH